MTYDSSRTPHLGLVFTSNATMDANLSRIDAAIGELKAALDAIPPPPEELLTESKER